MKILVYGFKPFLDLEKNTSEEIIKKIKPRNNLKKVVFDVKFSKEQFLAPIKKFKPDVIIGLGLWGRGEKIRIERKTINLFWKNRKEKSKKIIEKGPDYYFATLKIKKNNNSWLSYYAGKYV